MGDNYKDIDVFLNAAMVFSEVPEPSTGMKAETLEHRHSSRDIHSPAPFLLPVASASMHGLGRQASSQL